MIKAFSILQPNDNLKFILGDYPVINFNLDRSFRLSELLNEVYSNKKSSKSILSVKLNLITQFYVLVLNTLSIKSILGIHGLEQSLINEGFSIKQTIVAYPNLSSARFCFPYHDYSSRSFLFKEIFLPRQYSLNFFSRVLFKVLISIIKINKKSNFFYQSIFILIEKNEETT